VPLWASWKADKAERDTDGCRERLSARKGDRMDLRAFYQKLRKIEREIADVHVVVVSHETPDGGRPGQLAEVSRSIAARLILEGRARLATIEETAEFRAAAQKALQEAQQRQMADKVQVSVISEADLRAFKSLVRAEKR
jgi:uncharacterized Fe-S cluster-containing radical SAM superfamily enzyme